MKLRTSASEIVINNWLYSVGWKYIEGASWEVQFAPDGNFESTEVFTTTDTIDWMERMTYYLLPETETVFCDQSEGIIPEPTFRVRRTDSGSNAWGVIRANIQNNCSRIAR